MDRSELSVLTSGYSRDDFPSSPRQFISDITTPSKGRSPLAWQTRGPFDCSLHLFDIALFNLVRAHLHLATATRLRFRCDIAPNGSQSDSPATSQSLGVTMQHQNN